MFLTPAKIYQVLLKLADEQAELQNGRKRLTISTVYDSIKHSNSSLRRRSKKQLEDSIERVLIVLKEEQDDNESLDGDFEGIEEAPPVLKVGNLKMALMDLD
jgi:ribosome biogenesis ATPase